MHRRTADHNDSASRGTRRTGSPRQDLADHDAPRRSVREIVQSLIQRPSLELAEVGGSHAPRLGSEGATANLHWHPEQLSSRTISSMSQPSAEPAE